MTSTAPALPTELQVEVTGACNLRCRMCLVRYRPALDRSTASMDFATFRRLFDGLPGLRKVTLQGLGEPLMAPDLVPMIRYAAAHGCRVGFNTNGTFLTRSRAAELVDAGLDWLHVSVDGATAPTYEGIRGRAAFDRVAANVVSLVEVLRERRAERPTVCIVFVAQRSNIAELPELVRLVGEWGVPELRVQNLSHDFSDTGDDDGYLQIRDYAAAEALWFDRGDDGLAVLAEASRLAASLGVALRLPEEGDSGERRAAGTPGCDWPWRSAYVTYDAKVQPCCMVMGTERAVLGDASTHGVAGVWTSEQYVEFRQRLLGEDPPEVCRGCSMYRNVF
ncbi:MAG: radical SAM protein [Actinomycetota bacterium]|nr:radical SAM protein [Actinomycetota bacterium]